MTIETVFNSAEECECYRGPRAEDPGRQYELCMGRSYSERPVCIEVSKRWRVFHGLAPLQVNSKEGVLPTSASIARSQTDVKKLGCGQTLEGMFREIGISYREDCQCSSYAQQMDSWGVQGCRDHFDEIIDRLRQNVSKYSLWDQIYAAVQTVRTGLAFQVNPLDPFPGLLAEAIRRAENDVSTRNGE